MRKSALFYIAILLVIIPFFGSAQTNISGVINTYTPVTGFTGCNSITVQNSTGFTVGSKALIIQMKGADIDESNTAAFGTITDYNNSGNYEIIHITGITGNTIDYEFQLLNQYDLSGKVQLITIPEYTNVTITATLTGADWNGTVGGVLIFIASGTVTMNADIDISGKGFRGGNFSIAHGPCHFTDYFYPLGNGEGAEKGEGICETITGKETGRGAQANGGGGGNSHNGGGGGGGNASAGGFGGYEYDGAFCSNNMNTGTRGEGGKLLTYGNATQKIFLGGGGGGGQQNNDEGMMGTNGGGIIIIQANTIINNGNEIISSGPDAPLSGWDAAGGGGAGGTVLLDVQNFTNAITVRAIGGEGGSIDHPNPDCWGPGGGGSGGVAWFSNPPPGNVTSIVSGGLSGLRITSGSTCFNTSHGATDGNDGLSLNGLVINESTTPLSTITAFAGNDTALCTTTGFILGETPVAIGGTPPYTYAWLPAADLNNAALANPEATPVATTTYTLTVTDNNGCLGHDTIILTIGSGSVAITAPENTICPGDELALTATANADSYLWSTGETTAAVDINAPGDYWVQSTTADCDANDTITITAGEAPVFSLGNDTIVCSDISHNLKIPNVFNGDYLWSNGETTQSINVEGSGIYWLQVANGCGTGIDSIVVTFQSDSSNHVFFPNCFTPNSDKTNEEFVLLNAPANEYDFTVYNRWGNIIFQSFDPTNNWDGTYKGRDVEEGVYYFVATFKDCKGERLRKAGHITVLR
ncbi:MAG: gliding motility-associated C-terminal domain-containing protein [Bacteroidia bacterium]